ncbi:MAG: TonB family protein [Candidatus Margulisiibacteriota bacterium]
MKSFKDSFIKSLLIHLAFFIVLVIIPLSKIEKPLEYIEVSLIKGESRSENPQAPNIEKSVAANPELKKNRESKLEKTVTKKIAPAKMPETLPDKKQVPDLKPAEKAQELADQNIEKTTTASIDQKQEELETATKVSTPDIQAFQAVTGNLNLSGPITQRKVLYIITPEYPEWAVEQGVETEVSIEFWVNPEGRVKKADIIQRSGYLELDIIAKQALVQWLFDPLDPALPQKDQWGTVLIKYRLE